MGGDIVITGLKKSFGEKQVLRGLDARFPAGRITCVMGPSGCGKTTLLRILTGLTAADGGVVEGVPERLGVVFQEDRLCENLSAGWNMSLVCAKKPAAALIEAHLDAVRLSGAARLPARDMSGGMRRRLALARAVLALECAGEGLSSPALFLDEPFKGLDGDVKEIVMAYLRERARGWTVILITHDAEDAGALGAGLLVLPGGVPAG